jgi:hypothetical protein
MVAVLGVTGCGGDDSDLPEFSGGSPGASATPSAAVGGGSSGSGIEEIVDVPKRGTEIGDEDNPITVGQMAKADGDGVAVEVAYLRFWVERSKALRQAKVDQAALNRVATGDAAERVLSSVKALADKQQHAEGGSTVNVQSVKVKGETATLTDCFQDRSVVVDAQGKKDESAPTLSLYNVRLEKRTDTWVVSRLEKSGTPVCTP